jgi:pimeloyl-ACP methyl ester carboxylesterase
MLRAMSGDITGAWPGLSFQYVNLPGRGLKLHVGFQGPAAGPPVMLVHGFPESWYSWRHVAPRLAAAGYRVIMPALRGYERSDKPADPDAYHPNELGDDLAALLDALGIAQLTAVAGHDWGGIASWYLAMRHESRVARVISMNIPHPGVFAKQWAKPEQRRKCFYFYIFAKHKLAGWVWTRGDGYLIRWQLKKYAGGVPTDADVQPFADHAQIDDAMRFMCGYYTKLLSLDPKDMLAEVRDVSVPVRVLWGDQDPAFATELAWRTEEHCDGSKLKVRIFEGIGHFLHLQIPEVVAEAVLDAITD